MNWFHDLNMRQAQRDPSLEVFPHEFDLILGKLRGRVFYHTVEVQRRQTACWTYVSDGLMALQHKELALAFLCPPGRKKWQFSADPLHLFENVYQQASQGNRVDVEWGFTEFGRPGFLGSVEFRGLGYIAAQPLADLGISWESMLAPIVLKADELQVARQFGMARIMARLGQMYLHYPCPPWNDVTRPEVITLKEMEQSLLVRTPLARVPGITVRMEGNLIRMRARAASAESLRGISQLPEDAVVGILTDLDPQANACLVWTPGSAQPTAISAPGSDGKILSGAFALFVPQQDSSWGQVVEDGFVVMLGDEDWADLRRALIECQPYSLPPAENQNGFALDWA